MELSEVIRKRRSIRKFKDDPIPKEMINEIIKSAMFAPSAVNRRPVHLLVIEDRETIGKIRKLRESAFRFLETAPLAIVIAVENVGTWESDGAIVSTFIQLTCVDLGLGSCWGHIAEIVENEARKLLNIPERYRVLCVVGIGYPDEEKSPHDESEIDEKRIHWERF